MGIVFILTVSAVAVWIGVFDDLIERQMKINKVREIIFKDKK